jgi:hypothetical protein
VHGDGPASARQPNEQLLDQKAIIDDHDRRRRHDERLLICEIGVFDGADASVVPLGKNATKFGSSGRQATRHDECCVPEVDEPDLAALVGDTPPVA